MDNQQLVDIALTLAERQTVECEERAAQLLCYEGQYYSLKGESSFFPDTTNEESAKIKLMRHRTYVYLEVLKKLSADGELRWLAKRQLVELADLNRIGAQIIEYSNRNPIN